MNTEKALEIMKNIYHNDKVGKINPADIEAVLKCLEEGEKYKKIVEEINNERLFEEYDGVYGMPVSVSLKNIHQKIKDIIQKYFPPTKKAVLILDIKGTKEEVKDSVEYITELFKDIKKVTVSEGTRGEQI